MNNLHREYDIHDINRVDAKTKEGAAFLSKWKRINQQGMIICANAVNVHPAMVTLPMRSIQTFFQINATHYN